MPMTILELKPTSQLLGAKVAIVKGDVVGRIENLILDLETGRIAYAIVAKEGGVFGGGGQLFPVPWPAFHMGTQENTFVIDATPDTLRDAPFFDHHSLPDWTSVRWNNEMYAHYHLVPWWRQEEAGQAPQAPAPQSSSGGLMP